MSPRAFISFSVVTAVLVIAAIVVVAIRPAPTTIPRDRDLVFAGLDERINEVQALEIRTPARSFTVARDGDGWGIKELDGYDASFDKLKTVIVQLSEFKYLEPKTSDPDRYARLYLQDVGAQGAQSKQITVLGKDGKVLAKGLIGKKNEDLFGSGRGGTYMRFDDNKQAWLVEGTADLGDGPADWVDKDLVDIKREQIKRLVILSPKGGGTVVRRDTPETKDFTLEDIPEGKRQRGQWETNDMAKLLEGLKLLDVRLARDVEFPEGPYKGTIQTFDGLLVHSEAAKIGAKYWLRLWASVDPTKADVADEVRKRAEAINARHKGYVYEIEEGPGKKFTCDHVRLLEGAGVNACA